ncbi:hypothetical protein ACEPAH_4687 [Sanghuangporus vaninii]
MLKYIYVKGLDNWVKRRVKSVQPDAFEKYKLDEWMTWTTNLADVDARQKLIGSQTYTPRFKTNGQSSYRPLVQQTKQDPDAMDVDALRGLPKKGAKCYNSWARGDESTGYTCKHDEEYRTNFHKSLASKEQQGKD